MNNAPDNEKDMKLSIEKALDAYQSDGPEADIELIALLAEGGIDSLSESEQAELFDRISANSESGEILAEMLEMNLGGSASDSDAGASTESDSVCTTPQPPAENIKVDFSRRTRSIFGTWAIAACLLVGLMLWPYIQSDSGQTTGPNGQMQVYSNDNPQPNYWDQLDSKRISSTGHDGLDTRDIVIIIMAAFCVMLFILLVISICNDRRVVYTRTIRKT